jgi:alpha-1,3-glucosyltransferase
VHEKSILLPLLPITALAAWEPAAALWAPPLAAFSMFPLLERDGVGLAYAACILIYTAAMAQLAPAPAAAPAKGKPAAGSAPAAALLLARAGRAAGVAGALAAGALHVARAAVAPPEHLPWLHDRAFVSLSFVYVGAAMAYFNWLQWNQPGGGQLACTAGGGAAAGRPAPARAGKAKAA